MVTPAMVVMTGLPWIGEEQGRPVQEMASNRAQFTTPQRRAQAIRAPAHEQLGDGNVRLARGRRSNSRARFAEGGDDEVAHAVCGDHLRTRASDVRGSVSRS